MITSAKAFLIGASALLLSCTVASAEVVCNEDGDCWRVRGRVQYKPELRLEVRPDDWRWEERDNERYRWREAPSERGYWQGGVWVEVED
jgi:hypothetical protein